jgi:hypothetical protein
MFGVSFRRESRSRIMAMSRQIKKYNTAKLYGKNEWYGLLILGHRG